MIKNLITQQEGKTLEFKRDLSSPKSLLKSIVAFANTAGGHLIIGVNDERQIIGVEHPLDEEERLCNLIADSISPRLIPSIELVTLNNKTLLVIEVFVSNTGPHWINSEGSTQGIYVRLGSTNRQADQELITELHRRSEGVNFDEMPMPQLSVDDVDITKAQELFSDIKSLNEKNLLTLKLITSHQGKLVPTKGAILLFGKERNTYFPDAWVQCGRFIGKDKSRIFDHVDIYDYLPDAVESIMMFLKKHALRGADFSAVQRKDIWSIPLVMLREAVINALVHTDYSQRGAPIRISFFDDRIEIENPGILLPGLTIEDMRQGISKIRNHVIARVFRELNLIEQWGSGVSRIYSEAIEQKLQEPEIIEIGMRIRFIIYLAQGIPIDSTFDKRDKQLESRLESRLESKLAARVIQVLQNGEAGKIQIARSLGHQTVSGELHKQIKQLLKLEIIEMTIPDKPNSRLQKYRLTNKGIDLINIIQREL
ncbi:TPA: putative DNA binding domain-containing protein [Legionella pneumophila]|nr:putative DNA binding domain-containing protein [Legionella pneumophila]